MRTLTAADGLAEAQAGSYYTVVGTGGPLREWIEGYEKILTDKQVGKPQEWFTTTGHEVNEYARLVKRREIFPRDKFQPDLGFLMFPLDGLDISRLAMIKILMDDRWFDDLVESMQVER